MNIQPLTLEGCTIRLEPLSEGHVADLAQVGCDERIWRYMRYGDMRGEADIKAWVKILLDLQEAGDDLPFAVYHLEDGRAVGATRYMAISRTNRGLEIGGTWYGIDYQRIGVNTEAKYLLLGHAFEVLGCVRVQMKTDLRNTASQRAIERIGAKREGVLRNHMVLPGGFVRDSVYYSIIDSEWPGVKTYLEGLMARR